tara:strand:- start:4804 stop:5826 length:1023 start_codon:yes stop_codon:yes gene_type:complete
MAFLPNGGDIILDAVLTDIGRKRMSQGRFRISKFSAGDDEIDYGLYNKNHPSGNAYYDLEIMQTPILEAFTAKNANINYGLVSRMRQDLFYFPQADQNKKTFNTRIVNTNAEGLVFLADDTRVNATNEVTSQVLRTSIGSDAYIMKSNDTTGKYIFIETGISSTDLAASQQNQQAFLSANGLIDRNFIVTYDNRFISNVMGPTQSSRFANDISNEAQLSISLVSSTNIRQSGLLENHSEAVIPGLVNEVFANTRGTTSVLSDSSNNYSVFKGPRGSATAIALTINPNIPQSDYTKFGKTAQNIFNDGKTFDYIDTTIYIEGMATNAQIQIPVRLIKNAQT